jgi:hypothetical protein
MDVMAPTYGFLVLFVENATKTHFPDWKKECQSP